MFMVLMTRRTEKPYRAVFQHMLEVCDFRELRILMSDFEGPMRTAMDLFPNAVVKGCNWHFDRVPFFYYIANITEIARVKSFILTNFSM